MPSDTTDQKRIWLFYFPRAAHHLFMRMFSGHTSIEMIEVLEHMAPVVPLTGDLSGEASLDENPKKCEELQKTARQGWKAWQEHLQKVEDGGKRALNSYSIAFHISPAVVNEALHGKSEKIGDSTSPTSRAFWRLDPSSVSSEDNPTVFSDEFLLSHTPVLLIRNPILVFPSTVRAAQGYFEHDNGLKHGFMRFLLRYTWHRMIFDWYAKQPGARPLVLDADDLMYNPSAVAALCTQLGLDPQDTKYEWGKEAVDARYKKEEIFQDALAASTSINPGKSSEGVRIEDEVVKWKGEFGVERAKLLRELVEEAMDDYWYLRERSVGATSRPGQIAK